MALPFKFSDILINDYVLLKTYHTLIRKKEEENIIKFCIKWTILSEYSLYGFRYSISPQ